MGARRAVSWSSAVVAALVVLAACSSSPKPAPSTSVTPVPFASSTTPLSPLPTTSASSSAPSSPTPTPVTSTPAPPDKAHTTLAGMTEAQRVGQLFMAATSAAGVDPAALAAVRQYHVGSVLLNQRTTTGVAGTAAVTAALQAAAGPVRLFLATDQEGGDVQVIRGPGVSTVPSALDQGKLTPGVLRAQATIWGRQLAAAGINVDLAPVLDTVPSAAFAPQNPPIGADDREYGFDPSTVGTHGTAFALGLADAGVDATAKHFPGLGRVTGNTDTTAGVTDTQTTRTDPYLAAFRAAIVAGIPWVMMSTAMYAKIDPGTPAAFSRVIVTDILRGDLGFRGVIVSDDVGAAAQVASYPVAERALEFIAAGGDIVLTADSTQIPAMTAAVLARTQTDPAFKTQVDAAALIVLTAKQARGLL